MRGLICFFSCWLCSGS